MIRKPVIEFILVVLVLLYAEYSFAGDKLSENEDSLISHIKAIEESMRLPPQAASIESYTRYYASVTDDSGEKIIGIFLKKSGNFSYGNNVKIVQFLDLPKVFDGGCDVVRLSFDLVRKNFIYVACGGTG